MMLGFQDKQPGETLDYEIDYTGWLPSGDALQSIISVTATPAGLTLSPAAQIINANKGVAVWTSGGADGTTYKVTVKVQTNAGRIKEDEFRVRVREI